MQPSHSKFKRKYATWQEMPTNTSTEKIARLHRRYMDDKYAYVNARKVALESCEQCGVDVTEATTHCFDFAHKDAATKLAGVSSLCQSRQTLATARPLLDAEMAKCRLLCGPCHQAETRARNQFTASR